MPSSIFESRRVADLSSGAQFAIWCLRARACSIQTGEPPYRRLGRGFDLAGIQPAMRHFETLFEWLARGASQGVRIGCLKCSHVTADEGIVLAALAAYQRADTTSGEILLGVFLPRPACLNASVAAHRLAAAMQGADLGVAVAPAGADRPQARAHAQAQVQAQAASWPAASPGVPESKLVH